MNKFKDIPDWSTLKGGGPDLVRTDGVAFYADGNGRVTTRKLSPREVRKHVVAFRPRRKAK